MRALGIELVSREDEASAVVIIPPDIKKMKRGALARLEGLRRRARGLGTPVLELTELEALLEERERALYDRPDPRITWPDLYGKRVALLGRFRSTQRELMRRLRSRGVLTTPQLASADVLILGGGKRTAKQREALEGLDPDLIKINEVECLALLDAPEPFSLPS